MKIKRKHMYIIMRILGVKITVTFRYNIVTTTDWPGGSLKSLTSTPGDIWVIFVISGLVISHSQETTKD